VVVEREDLVRGFQHAKDQCVQITEEELESLEAEANKSIDLKEFIPLASVDPVYFENTHYLAQIRAAKSRIVSWLTQWQRAVVLRSPNS
jgi:non-homologous end joining protein Ku